MVKDFEVLAKQIGELLRKKNLTLVVAESCTGGGIAQTITATPESSSWFERGFVTYSDVSKQEMLNVAAETLQKYGAVSEKTVQEMAEGALKNSHAQISIAVTGIAGPTGGSPDKPIGLVWFGWSMVGKKTVIQSKHFVGDREAVRKQAVYFALTELLKIIDTVNPTLVS